jgi:hypothetical protein
VPLKATTAEQAGRGMIVAGDTVILRPGATKWLALPVDLPKPGAGTTGDFWATVTIRIDEKPRFSSGGLLFWRTVDNSNYYLFEIDSGGNASVSHWTGSRSAGHLGGFPDPRQGPASASARP